MISPDDSSPPGDGALRIVLSNASSAWGGLHHVTETLARGLARRGHAVTLFCRPATPLHGRMKDVVPTLPILGATDFGPAAIARCARALRRLRAHVGLTLADKDVRQTGPAAWLARVPVVVSRPNDTPLKRRPHVPPLYGGIPAAHVSVSRAARETLLASAPWLGRERVHVVHNAVDAAAIASTPPADLGLPAGALAVGFAGRFDAGKGVLELSAAWPAVARALPAAWLVIAGKGPMENEFRRRLADAERVVWLGHRTDVPAVFRACHLVAVPSHREAFGLVALEALAAGAPVVASRTGGLPEVVRDGVDGVLVPPRDSAALADALVALAREPARRAEMAMAGPAQAARFTVDRQVDAYEALLRGVAIRGAP